jgi:mono/diheme cytochrome c family protein
MSRTLSIAALAIAAAAAPQPAREVTQAARPVAEDPVLSPGARRGLAFAQERCSACHAVIENRTSPNPESPPFEDIANGPGVTRQTLQQFLRNSHNYPAAMNFTVDPARINGLADYIATMKKADYRPVM